MLYGVEIEATPHPRQALPAFTQLELVSSPTTSMAHTSTNIKGNMSEPPLSQITLTAHELSTKQLSSHNLQAALQALYEDGACVITNAVNPAHLDKLNTRMVNDAETLYTRPATHRNFGAETGNIQQEPVIEPGFLFNDILANPWATSITECILGPNPHLRFYSANTAFNASGRQPVHIDPDFDFPRMPFGLCININLVDTDPENGATELWLASHSSSSVHSSDANGVREGLLETRRMICPPIQPTLPKGAMLIRDFRLWHAGMPNRTDEPRVMLVLIQFPAWYRSDQRFCLPKSAKGKVDWGHLVPRIEWVDDDYDYLAGRHDHDFSLKP